MRTHRPKPSRQNAITGEAQICGRTRHTHVKEPLKQIGYPLRETINAYEKDGFNLRTLYMLMLYVENAYLTSVPYNTAFLAANDQDTFVGQNVPARLDQRIDLGVSVNKHGNRG